MDFNRAFMLLHICDKAKEWPQLRRLHDAAMAELMALQEPKAAPKAEPTPAPEPSTEEPPAVDRR